MSTYEYMRRREQARELRTGRLALTFLGTICAALLIFGATADDPELAGITAFGLFVSLVGLIGLRPRKPRKPRK